VAAAAAWQQQVDAGEMAVATHLATHSLHHWKEEGWRDEEGCQYSQKNQTHITAERNYGCRYLKIKLQKIQIQKQIN
jgi:hypothetical protein